MAHVLIPQIVDVATPIANGLGLSVVGAIFHTNQNPPVLRVDIRNLEGETSLEDCERMSRALEVSLDAAGTHPWRLYLRDLKSRAFPVSINGSRVPLI